MKHTYSSDKSNPGKWLIRSEKEENDDPFEDFPKPGAFVTVTKRNGETKEAQLGRERWEGENREGFAVKLHEIL